MNKEKVIKVISLSFISISLAIVGVIFYYVFIEGVQGSTRSFLLGLSTSLVILIPIAFRKNGLYYKMMIKKDERQLVITILTAYLTTLLLFLVAVSLLLYYIKTGEISYVRAFIKLGAVICAKFYINFILNSYL